MQLGTGSGGICDSVIFSQSTHRNNNFSHTYPSDRALPTRDVQPHSSDTVHRSKEGSPNCKTSELHSICDIQQTIFSLESTKHAGTFPGIPSYILTSPLCRETTFKFIPGWILSVTRKPSAHHCVRSHSITRGNAFTQWIQPH